MAYIPPADMKAVLHPETLTKRDKVVRRAYHRFKEAQWENAHSEATAHQQRLYDRLYAAWRRSEIVWPG